MDTHELGNLKQIIVLKRTQYFKASGKEPTYLFICRKYLELLSRHMSVIYQLDGSIYYRGLEIIVVQKDDFVAVGI